MTISIKSNVLNALIIATNALKDADTSKEGARSSFLKAWGPAMIAEMIYGKKSWLKAQQHILDKDAKSAIDPDHTFLDCALAKDSIASITGIAKECYRANDKVIKGLVANGQKETPIIDESKNEEAWDKGMITYFSKYDSSKATKAKAQMSDDDASKFEAIGFKANLDDLRLSTFEQARPLVNGTTRKKPPVKSTTTTTNKPSITEAGLVELVASGTFKKTSLIDIALDDYEKHRQLPLGGKNETMTVKVSDIFFNGDKKHVLPFTLAVAKLAKEHRELARASVPVTG